MGQERRQFLRHPIKVPIKLRITGQKDTLKCQSADLSEGGLHFLWPENMAKGSLLEISIPIAEKLFKLNGRVAYSFEDAHTGLYRTGISFEGPTMSFRVKLAEEILRIQEFREETSRTVGRLISEEEAASRWIKKYAEKFARLY